ncbi:MAG: methionine biosynthesis protein MetW [Gammaproteobacteria bacterium]|nr:methionine biosynthesis protein MetW [Gammaproteobacteria bacterium]
MRPDLEIIQHWIKPGSKVLDLGCGDGNLLQYLKQTREVSDIGLEIDAANINQCLAKGVNVLEQDIDNGLSNFQSNSFDTVLLTQTLQALSNPDLLIDEMLRVGKNCIVTFPNFGNWKSRLYLLRRGRMPVSRFMPYQWYDTPNIHFCTVKDFDTLCAEKNIRILTRTVVDNDHQGSWLIKTWPNLLGEIAIYHITRDHELSE